MEIPDSIDRHVDILIPGIESEEVEEINDAYKDILEELGNIDTLTQVTHFKMAQNTKWLSLIVLLS